MTYKTDLTFWPATPLTADVAHELYQLGVSLSTFQIEKGKLTASRAADQATVLNFDFDDMRYGLDDLEALLATLRLAHISYVAWDLEDGAAAGNGRTYSAGGGTEKRFTVTAAGEPVLRAGGLDEQNRHGNSEHLIEALQQSLHLPIPAQMTPLAINELKITIRPDDEQLEERIQRDAPLETDRASHA